MSKKRISKRDFLKTAGAAAAAAGSVALAAPAVHGASKKPIK